MTNDFIIIGGGIAGISLGARLANYGSVKILEMEGQPGYHATGRSAAYFAPAYGNDVVREITAASEAFFRNPPDDFADAALLHPRDSLFVARKDQRAAMDKLREDSPQLVPLNTNELKTSVPILNTTELVSGLRDPFGGDLDVHAILQGFLRQFRVQGGELLTNTHVKALQRQNGSWLVKTNAGDFSAAIIINAAGAWADKVAMHAGLAAIGLTPLRRTAILVDAPAELDISQWPLIIDVDEHFYVKPDAGQLLISPADEIPSEPCDAQPDELDIAIVVDRIQQVTDLDITKINHRWAGLRTFSPDRSFVAGFDPRTTGFFWLAAQGGYGVQTCPALSDLATQLLTNSHKAQTDIMVKKLGPLIAPDRFL
ncbi:MAG: FAD-binding oxidoreductase [Pseudomonadales bacterium]